LHLSGQLREAELHYRRATELRPDNAEAHANLARLLATDGKRQAAAEHYAIALRLQPDTPRALAGLAWLRATAPESAVRGPDEAIRLAERAAELTSHRDAGALDVLAAAYASANRFDEAVRVSREAMVLADGGGLQS